jgi:hypothetical protein
VELPSAGHEEGDRGEDSAVVVAGLGKVQLGEEATFKCMLYSRPAQSRRAAAAILAQRDRALPENRPGPSSWWAS